MRDHILAILRNTRMLQGDTQHFTREELLGEIETNARALLQGDKHIVPSKLFGDITIPKDVLACMSRGDDDIWFSVSKHIDVNISYCGEPEHWQYILYPVKNGDIDTSTELEIGRL